MLFLLLRLFSGHKNIASYSYFESGDYSLQFTKIKCTACMKCSDICPTKCIDIKTKDSGNIKSLTVNSKKCISCLLCVDVCPEDAMVFEKFKEGSLNIKLLTTINFE
jgi:formate hydrogenlyase subunit 6/NADH:ubiquinone oxidoreductase subunit I